MKKFFKAGDHVKITGGRHEGMTGNVVNVTEMEVIILSDLNMDELKARPHNVRLDAQVSTGVDQMGQFQFHDLVNLDADTVGVIIRLEKDYVEVLNMHGAVVRVKAISIKPRGKNAKFAKAFDAGGNTIQAGDLVKVADSAQVRLFCRCSKPTLLRFSKFSTLMMMSELVKSSTFSVRVFLFTRGKT